jgi:thioredoxin-dependent peroxiredoxin
MVQEGDAFPEFSLPDQDGNVITNEDLMRQKTVVYFYPKDDTPGCTVEACEFRDLTPSYAGARVIGVSPDNTRSHVKFIGKFNLNFTLLSDEKHKLAEACGSWVEKTMLGRTYMGVERSTFLLNEQGKIVKIWRKVKAQGHAQEVVAALA